MSRRVVTKGLTRGDEVVCIWDDITEDPRGDIEGASLARMLTKAMYLGEKKDKGHRVVCLGMTLDIATSTFYGVLTVPFGVIRFLKKREDVTEEDINDALEG